DVYLLGVNEPVKEYVAKIIGIAHRENDNEDKLVAAPEDTVFIKQEKEENREALPETLRRNKERV
ncbi:MAG: hypothetical protein IIV88_01880, partial [Erysipelotrichaceae bacterium]|nr:hypothetical protein [Erysipelotrichaceae bacterium]